MTLYRVGRNTMDLLIIPHAGGKYRVEHVSSGRTVVVHEDEVLNVPLHDTTRFRAALVAIAANKLGFNS